jgi:hypothetical protein
MSRPTPSDSAIPAMARTSRAETGPDREARNSRAALLVARQEFLQNIHGPNRVSVERIVTTKDILGLLHAVQPQYSQQSGNVLAIVIFLAEAHGQALHSQEILGMRHKYAQVGQFLVNFEAPAWLKKPLTASFSSPPGDPHVRPLSLRRDVVR